MVDYTKNGWTINKDKVALYALKDSTKGADISDLVCDDAVTVVESALKSFKENILTKVDKTNEGLNHAIVFAACCLMSRSGISVQKTGNIQSESIDGMSASYGSEQQINHIKTPVPQDYCAMSQHYIQDYINTFDKRTKRKYSINVTNQRDALFKNTLFGDISEDSSIYR